MYGQYRKVLPMCGDHFTVAPPCSLAVALTKNDIKRKAKEK